ncbi:hypothetical protein [Rhodocyclus gracilis]|nr:hypothetical protein [Rhodocyclus gracilis]
MNKIIPTMPEVLREAIIVAAGALIAALVVRSLPQKYRDMFSLTPSNDK